MKTEKHKVQIEDLYDGFVIIVDDERFVFDQEDTREKLVDVFEKLGFTADYEEVC